MVKLSINVVTPDQLKAHQQRYPKPPAMFPMDLEYRFRKLHVNELTVAELVESLAAQLSRLLEIQVPDILCVRDSSFCDMDPEYTVGEYFDDNDDIYLVISHKLPRRDRSQSMHQLSSPMVKRLKIENSGANSNVLNSTLTSPSRWLMTNSSTPNVSSVTYGAVEGFQTHASESIAKTSMRQPFEASLPSANGTCSQERQTSVQGGPSIPIDHGNQNKLTSHLVMETNSMVQHDGSMAQQRATSTACTHLSGTIFEGVVQNPGDSTYSRNSGTAEQLEQTSSHHSPNIMAQGAGAHKAIPSKDMGPAVRVSPSIYASQDTKEVQSHQGATMPASSLKSNSNGFKAIGASKASELATNDEIDGKDKAPFGVCTDDVTDRSHASGPGVNLSGVAATDRDLVAVQMPLLPINIAGVAATQPQVDLTQIQNSENNVNERYSQSNEESQDVSSRESTSKSRETSTKAADRYTEVSSNNASPLAESEITQETMLKPALKNAQPYHNTKSIEPVSVVREYLRGQSQFSIHDFVPTSSNDAARLNEVECDTVNPIPEVQLPEWKGANLVAGIHPPVAPLPTGRMSRSMQSDKGAPKTKRKYSVQWKQLRGPDEIVAEINKEASKKAGTGIVEPKNNKQRVREDLSSGAEMKGASKEVVDPSFDNSVDVAATSTNGSANTSNSNQLPTQKASISKSKPESPRAGANVDESVERTEMEAGINNASERIQFENDKSQSQTTVRRPLLEDTPCVQPQNLDASVLRSTYAGHSLIKTSQVGLSSTSAASVAQVNRIGASHDTILSLSETAATTEEAESNCLSVAKVEIAKITPSEKSASPDRHIAKAQTGTVNESSGAKNVSKSTFDTSASTKTHGKLRKVQSRPSLKNLRTLKEIPSVLEDGLTARTRTTATPIISLSMRNVTVESDKKANKTNSAQFEADQNADARVAPTIKIRRRTHAEKASSISSSTTSSSDDMSGDRSGSNSSKSSTSDASMSTSTSDESSETISSSSSDKQVAGKPKPRVAGRKKKKAVAGQLNGLIPNPRCY